MCDTCGDDRFEVIENYKQKLLDATNIGDSPEEMAVIDNILFRFWQMGWLKGDVPSAQQWIPCSERLPEEDYWLGGSGRQFSEKVMVTIVNHSDEDTWVGMTQTIDGEWACELPKYCEIVAWMPLPTSYIPEGDDKHEG